MFLSGKKVLLCLWDNGFRERKPVPKQEHFLVSSGPCYTPSFGGLGINQEDMMTEDRSPIWTIPRGEITAFFAYFTVLNILGLCFVGWHEHLTNQWETPNHHVRIIQWLDMSGDEPLDAGRPPYIILTEQSCYPYAHMGDPVPDEDLLADYRRERDGEAELEWLRN